MKFLRIVYGRVQEKYKGKKMPVFNRRIFCYCDGMSSLRRLFGTIEVIRFALSPGVSPAAAGRNPYCRFPDFSSAVDERGRLEIFYPDCYFPAAVALLFRLKRQGFSACRATVRDSGILLTAER